jgi:beta-lactamase class A
MLIRLVPVALVALTLTAQQRTAVEVMLEAKLLDRIRDIGARSSGVLGFAAIDLATGHIISLHGDAVFPQASSIKIPVMIEVFDQAKRGRLKLTDTATLTDRESVGGSGHLRMALRSGQPLTISIEQLVTAMIETSDNTATNRLIQAVGMQSVNTTLEKLGFRQTRLQRIMLDAEAASRNEENISTPLEMARIVELIYRGKAVDEASSRRMIEIMKLVQADFRAVIPENIPVASKPGGLAGVHCETGVVLLPRRPFVLSVASTFLTEPENPVRDVTRLVYEHFAKLARSNSFGNGGVR